MTRRTIRFLSIAVIATAIVFGLLIHWPRRGSSSLSDEIVESRPDLDGSFWLIPNLEEAHVFVPDRPHSHQEVQALKRGGASQLTRIREFDIRTNALGLRGPELPAAKPDGEFRILALGDSVTMGWGVEEKHSYPPRLEEELGRRGHQVRVLNAGVPGSPPGAMNLFCERVAPGLEIDLVLWARRPPRPALPGPGSYQDAVRGCRQALGTDVLVILPPISSFDRNGRQVRHGELAALEASLGAEGIPIVELTDIFWEAQGNRGERMEIDAQTLAVVDQETGKTWLEVPASDEGMAQIYSLFEREPQVREALFFDDGHPDADGFKVFVQEIADQVEQFALIP